MLVKRNYKVKGMTIFGLFITTEKNLDNAEYNVDVNAKQFKRFIDNEYKKCVDSKQDIMKIVLN